MLNKLLRWARITKAGDDSNQFAVQQMDYNGKVADGLIVFPYGIHGNVPPGALALMFSVGGNPENRAAIAWTPKTRPELAEGEVAFYHPLIPDLIIKLQADGKMLIKSGVEVTIDVPLATFTGDVQIDGDLGVTGASALSGDVTSDGVNISDKHKHSGVTTGAGNTGNPI